MNETNNIGFVNKFRIDGSGLVPTLCLSLE